MSNPSVAAKYQVLQISKNGRSFPLQSKVTSFDYYESLLSPNVTATMSFVDSGLVEDGDSQVTYDKEYDTSTVKEGAKDPYDDRRYIERNMER